MKTKSVKHFEQDRDFTLVKLKDLRSQMKNLIKLNVMSEHEKYALANTRLCLLSIKNRFELSREEAKQEYFRQKWYGGYRKMKQNEKFAVVFKEGDWVTGIGKHTGTSQVFKKGELRISWNIKTSRVWRITWY